MYVAEKYSQIHARYIEICTPFKSAFLHVFNLIIIQVPNTVRYMHICTNPMTACVHVSECTMATCSSNTYRYAHDIHRGANGCKLFKKYT